MKTFTDAAGRAWTLTLTLGTAMKVKAKLDIDLLQPEAGDPRTVGFYFHALWLTPREQQQDGKTEEPASE